MKKAVNFFRGSVRVTVEIPYPERLINLCALNNIEFWDFKRTDATTVRLSLHISGYRRLTGLADKAGFLIVEVKKEGVPFFLWRLRKRYILLAGAAAVFVAVWAMSLFVWEIDVYGNDRVTKQQILSAMKDQGVGIGSFGPTIVSEAISNDLILHIPDLSWIAVNVYGSRAEILVRERIEKPEILDEDAPMMVYAVKPGIIEKTSVLEGACTLKKGDSVTTGDILITGIMDSLVGDKRTVHAMGDIWARTWYELSAQTALETYEKAYTGEKEKKTALVIAGNRINLYFNAGISFPGYDKITTVKYLTLPGGLTLPIAVARDEYVEYDAVAAQLSVLDAETLLQKSLLDRLDLMSGGDVVKTDFSTTLENGVVTVTLTAECLEQIAAERPFTQEELQMAALPEPEEEPAQ